MGNEISSQLLLLCRAGLLGLCIGLFYDLLRALRLRLPRLAPALDFLCCPLAAAAVFLFILQVGDGELRIFVAGGIVGGCVLFFCLFSAILRPLWSFWVDAMAAAWHFFLFPLQKGRLLLHKVMRNAKKSFHFLKKWDTIVNYKWTVIRIRRQEGRSNMAKTKRAAKKRPKAGFLTKLVILALLVGVGWQLYHLQGKIQLAEAENASLATQVATQTQINAALEHDIQNADNQELMAQIARDELGLVGPGEKVFYDVSN